MVFSWLVTEARDEMITPATFDFFSIPKTLESPFLANF